MKTFGSRKALESWMRANHARASELWLRMHKKGSGLPSVSLPEALDIMLCWGWIDGIRKGLDGQSFLQRYTPRRARSTWSQINRDHVARLSEAGRMKPAGRRQVELAKADGRWEAAYAPIRTVSADSLPPDLLRAIQANKKAQATFKTLSRQNLFSLSFRTQNMKTPAGRARKIETLVAMLARGETIVPQKQPQKQPPKKPPKKTRTKLQAKR